MHVPTSQPIPKPDSVSPANHITINPPLHFRRRLLRHRSLNHQPPNQQKLPHLHSRSQSTNDSALFPRDLPKMRLSQWYRLGRKSLTIDEEKNGKKPADEVNAVVRRQREVQACDIREAGIDKSSLGLGVRKWPVLYEKRVHFSRNLISSRMAKGLPG